MENALIFKSQSQQQDDVMSLKINKKCARVVLVQPFNFAAKSKYLNFLFETV